MGHKFSAMRQLVRALLNDYETVRAACNITREGLSKSISREAQPFLEGHVTIAVTGEMSSGKSTLINSLIERNILPTGHFQTTSALTLIEAGDEDKMTVTYGDGREETHSDVERFPEILRKIVAVEEEYASLPIHHINILLLGGDSSWEILRKKDSLSHRSGVRDIDYATLRRYAETHPKSTIATRVEISLRLDKSFEGWRFIDTPGIGAIGGIQDATKELLFEKDDSGSPKVDALIMLLNSEGNVESEAVKSFADEIEKSIGSLLRGRMFLILTKAGSTAFQEHKDDYKKRLKQIYFPLFGLDDDRLADVDSLIHRFRVDAKAAGLDLTGRESWREPLPGWAPDEWKVVKNLRSRVEDATDDRGIEHNNESYFAELRRLDNFDGMKVSLTQFLTNAKEGLFQKFVRDVQTEIRDYLQETAERRQALSNGLPGIQKKKEQVEKERRDLNSALNRLRNDYTRDSVTASFDFIDASLAALEQCEKIEDVRTAYLQILNRVSDAQKALECRIKSSFANYAATLNVSLPTLRGIDLDEIGRQAQKAAEYETHDESRPVQKLIKEGGWSSSDEYATTYPYTVTRTDLDKKRREFTALVVMKGRNAKNQFILELRTKLKLTLDGIAKSIAQLTAEKQAELDRLAKNIGNQEIEIQRLNAAIARLQEAESAMRKRVAEYQAS